MHKHLSQLHPFIYQPIKRILATLSFIVTFLRCILTPGYSVVLQFSVGSLIGFVECLSSFGRGFSVSQSDFSVFILVWFFE